MIFKINYILVFNLLLEYLHFTTLVAAKEIKMNREQQQNVQEVENGMSNVTVDSRMALRNSIEALNSLLQTMNSNNNNNSQRPIQLYVPTFHGKASEDINSWIFLCRQELTVCCTNLRTPNFFNFLVIYNINQKKF